MRNSEVAVCGRGWAAQLGVWVVGAAMAAACGGADAAGPKAATADDSSLLADDTPGGSQSPQFEQGLAAIREEKFEQAQAHFEQVVAAEPRNAQAVFYLGVAQQSLG